MTPLQTYLDKKEPEPGKKNIILFDQMLGKSETTCKSFIPPSGARPMWSFRFEVE